MCPIIEVSLFVLFIQVFNGGALWLPWRPPPVATRFDSMVEAEVGAIRSTDGIFISKAGVCV